MSKVRVLHFSDPQFGPYLREELTRSLLDHAEEIRREQGIDLVVVTGDIAEFSKPKEYAKALAFFEALASRLELDRARILFVPGNHDVSWSRYESYQRECEERDEDPVPPFWPKWHYYVEFLDTWYGQRPHFTPGEPWSWWLFEDLGLVVVGLNSTLPETNECHDWSVGEEQRRWFLGRLKGAPLAMRLGLVHHDLITGGDAERRGRDLLRDLRLGVLLHGHTHEATTQRLGQTPVLGVGSLSVGRRQRPEDVGNQVQLLTLVGSAVHRQLWQYHGPRDAWLLHDQVLREEDRSFELPAVLGEPGPSGEPHERGRSRLHAPERERSSFAEDVAEALRLHEPGGDRLEIHALDEELVEIVDGRHRRLVAALEEPNERSIQRYLDRLAHYRADDPTLPARVIHRGDPTEYPGVLFQSFARVQELIDLSALRRWQQKRLEEDQRYRSELYVPQRGRWHRSSGPPAVESAVDELYAVLTEPGEHPNLALVLAPFGTGKTFVVREIARRLEQAYRPGERVPIWIELRQLEKATSFDELLAAHLARTGQRRFDLNQLQYLRRQGRIVLLFDGFDELVLRVSYDRATEHLRTIAEAARGNARVLVTSRTEHFLSTSDAEGALMRALQTVDGLRILRLEPFNAEEAAEFLRLRLGDRAQERLRAIDGLLDLARTPRMLDMIAGLDDSALDQVTSRGRDVKPSDLYEVVITKWLHHETQRSALPGAPMPLHPRTVRVAIGWLAERAWGRPTEELAVSDLQEVAAGLDAGEKVPDEIAHSLGVGTLLVRDEHSRFRFVHRSLLEFLVAESSAAALRAGEPPTLLDRATASGTTLDFLWEMAGDLADEWAKTSVSPGHPPVRRDNALSYAARRKLKVGLDLSGQDLRGRDDLRDLDLRGAHLARADLRGVDLSGKDLTGVDLTEANLEGANLTSAILDDALLTGANVDDARFLAAKVDRAVGLELGEPAPLPG